MRTRHADPVDRGASAATTPERERRLTNDRSEEPFRVDGKMRREDPQREALPADRDQAKRQMQTARRPSGSACGPAERRVASRWKVDGRSRTPTSDPNTAARGDGPAAARQLNDIYSDTDGAPARAITEAEQAKLTEFEVRDRERRELRDGIYRQLRNDAQACVRAMCFSPKLDSPEEWETTVDKALDDYRSGRALMDQLGADRLLDAPTAGKLLAIRRGLIEETKASSATELVLIDLAVIDFANAMRLQSMIGNTALIIEAEMFGQPTLRAKWKKKYGGRPEDIAGLAVEEHVARLRDQILPLVERAQRLAREHLEAIGRMHQQPALSVERAEAVNVVLIAPGTIVESAANP